uniref:Uncharacterized protein n=1 Tax=Grateloupia filicina TaxID=31455 RepID=A0A2S1FXD9_9FLOR|nr:hypothetical protein Grafi_p074 [Grateloupia filicina]AWD77432.1 hypothetical protein Grafi_p074 [Grateloupia filicina]
MNFRFFKKNYKNINLYIGIKNQIFLIYTLYKLKSPFRTRLKNIFSPDYYIDYKISAPLIIILLSLFTFLV